MLGNLTNLKRIYLFDNQLTGMIPEELGDLTNLKTLYLNDNRLTGMIPGVLGNLTNLVRLYLTENDLTGCIPNGLQDVPKNDFPFLGLGFCDGTSPTPPEDGSDPGNTGTAGDLLIDRYDVNNNGTIEKNEVIKAINDYLFGEGDQAISKAEVIELINLYLFG